MNIINDRHYLKVLCRQILDLREHQRCLQEKENELKKSVAHGLLYKSENGKEEKVDENDYLLDVVIKSGLPVEVVDDIVGKAHY